MVYGFKCKTQNYKTFKKIEKFGDLQWGKVWSLQFDKESLTKRQSTTKKTLKWNSSKFKKNCSTKDIFKREWKEKLNRESI